VGKIDEAGIGNLGDPGNERYGSASLGLADLQERYRYPGISRRSLAGKRAIDATNPGLVAFVGWNLPDLGRLCTIPREGAQGKATEGTAEQLTFLNEPVANLTSIGGNVSGEDVTEINGTLVWF
jgi:hypothetical protein